MFAFAKVNLYIKHEGKWSHPIPGVGGSMLVTKEKSGLHSSDEGYKMAITDALSVACKMVGVAADVYMGRMDGSKYAGKPSKQEPTKGKSKPKEQPKIKDPQAPATQAQYKAIYAKGYAHWNGVDKDTAKQAIHQLAESRAAGEKLTKAEASDLIENFDSHAKHFMNTEDVPTHQAPEPAPLFGNEPQDNQAGPETFFINANFNVTCRQMFSAKLTHLAKVQWSELPASQQAENLIAIINYFGNGDDLDDALAKMVANDWDAAVEQFEVAQGARTK